MDAKAYVRDPDTVKKTLVETEDHRLVTKKGCKIYIPSAYKEKQLVVIGDDIYILGVYALVVNDREFALSSTIAMHRITPTSTNTVYFGDLPYLEFTFEPGATVIANTLVVVSNTLPYVVFEELVDKGNIPWYMGYTDIAQVFESAPEFAGLTIAPSHTIMEMIVATMARVHNDRTQYYRHKIETMSELKTTPPEFIGFKNVAYGATNTTAKLMGAHFAEGLSSALVYPAERRERIETYLRS